MKIYACKGNKANGDIEYSLTEHVQYSTCDDGVYYVENEWSGGRFYVVISRGWRAWQHKEPLRVKLQPFHVWVIEHPELEQMIMAATSPFRICKELMLQRQDVPSEVTSILALL